MRVYFEPLSGRVPEVSHETRVWWLDRDGQILSGRVTWKGGSNTGYLLHIRDASGDLHKRRQADVVFRRPFIYL